MNHANSLNLSAVITGDVDNAARQYTRNKPDQFYNNLTPQESKISSDSHQGDATAQRIVNVAFDVGSESLHSTMELPGLTLSDQFENSQHSKAA